MKWLSLNYYKKNGLSKSYSVQKVRCTSFIFILRVDLIKVAYVEIRESPAKWEIIFQLQEIFRLLSRFTCFTNPSGLCFGGTQFIDQVFNLQPSNIPYDAPKTITVFGCTQYISIY